MKWLKLWAEARNDGKLRSLTDRQHRIWFDLLCYVGEQEPPGRVRASWKLLAAECADCEVEALRDAVSEMESLQLVTCRYFSLPAVTGVTEEVEIAFPAYEKRQARYPSDDRKRVAERVARLRARRKSVDVTRSNEGCNGHVTPVTTQKQTTEIKKTPHKPPKGGDPSSFVPPDWVPVDKWNAWIKGRKKKPTLEALELAVKHLEEFKGRGHDPKTVLENAIVGGWTGLFEPNKPRGASRDESHGKTAVQQDPKDTVASLQRPKFFADDERGRKSKEIWDRVEAEQQRKAEIAP